MFLWEFCIFRWLKFCKLFTLDEAIHTHIRTQDMEEFIVNSLKSLDIGLLLALGGMFWFFYKKIDARFEKIDLKFEKIDVRFENMDSKFEKKFDCIDTKFDKMDEKFNKIDEKFDAITAKMEEKFDAMTAKMDEKFDKVNERIDKLCDSVTDMDRRLCRVEGSLSTHGCCLMSQYKHKDNKVV